MKKGFKLNQLFVSLMILGCSFSFVSCDSDDDKTPMEPTTKDAWGEFKGNMQIFSVAPSLLTANEQTGTEIAATVNNDTVYFNNFPIKDLVATLVPEDQVETIVKAIGEVKYKVGYKSALNAAKDSVYMEYDPKPLELKVPLSEEVVMDVKVMVSAMGKGSYELSSKNYKFNVNAEKVTVNGGDFSAFPASTIKFALTKNK